MGQCFEISEITFQTWAVSFLDFARVPKRKLLDTSKRKTRVCSLSSLKSFTKGRSIRAETFQSIKRISSPGVYSLYSSKVIPEPLKAAAYWPEKMSLAKKRPLI